MTGQQPGPRIVPPDEARGLIRDHQAYAERRAFSATRTDLEFYAVDLAHTAAVLGEQRDAALALHHPEAGWLNGGVVQVCDHCEVAYPCPTADIYGAVCPPA